VHWYNNSHYDNLASGHRYGFNVSGLARAVLKNNAVFATCVRACRVTVDGPVDMDFNNWYRVGSSGALYFKGASYNHTDIEDGTVYAQQGVEGHGRGWGLASDPQYVNPPVDLSLQPDSSCVDAGTEIAGFSNDYLGNPRTGPWDIGALEYVSDSGIPNPPSALRSVDPPP